MHTDMGLTGVYDPHTHTRLHTHKGLWIEAKGGSADEGQCVCVSEHRQTTHCLADLFKGQELCSSFPASCSQKYLSAHSAISSLFCVSVQLFYVIAAQRDWHTERLA